MRHPFLPILLLNIVCTSYTADIFNSIKLDPQFLKEHKQCMQPNRTPLNEQINHQKDPIVQQKKLYIKKTIRKREKKRTQKKTRTRAELVEWLFQDLTRVDLLSPQENSMLFMSIDDLSHNKTCCNL